MAAHSESLGALAFGLGIVAQALLMLRGRFRRGDATRAAWAALIGVLGLFPMGGARPYTPLPQVPFALGVTAMAFAFFFRERLLARVGARLLLAWNILLVFAIVSAGWAHWGVLLALFPPTYLTVANAFTDIDRDFRLRVVLQVWFLIILVLVALTGFDVGPFRMFLHGRDPAAVRSPGEMFVAGAAYVYFMANAWFLLAPLPALLSRGEHWSQRSQEIGRHLQLLARGYALERHDLPRSLAVLVALPILLAAAARWAPERSHAVLSLGIALLPWLGGVAETKPPVPAPERAR